MERLDRSESGVFTLLLKEGENVVDPTLVASLSSALARVEAAEHPKALVIRGTGKFFCNGLSLDWMAGRGEEREVAAELVEPFQRLVLARLLTLDCRTVCAFNGHAFGAGLFLGLACDWRLMRTGRGWLNFPELNLGMRLTAGFAELVKCKLSPTTLREAVLTGRRYSSSDAVAAGLVDEECSVEELPARAEALAEAGLPARLGVARFDAHAFSLMKYELYVAAFRALTDGCGSATGNAITAPQSRL